MNKEDYSALRKAVEDTFTSLYVIDVGSLTPSQRQTHQEALAAAYLAVIRLENKQFSELTAQTLQNLDSLRSSAIATQEQLAGFKKATQTLEVVGGMLDVLATIAKILA